MLKFGNRSKLLLKEVANSDKSQLVTIVTDI